MSAQLTDEEALNRVASYCSTAEHCRAEINEKLQRWGIAYDTIARILDRLESEKFIDDERFCRAFVNDKFRFAKWGKMKIAQGLYMKKIPSDVAWRYLSVQIHDSWQIASAFHSIHNRLLHGYFSVWKPAGHAE